MMEVKTALHLIIAFLSVVLTLPISFYLQYKILSMIGSTELMWVLFFLNIPVIIIIGILQGIVKAID